MTTDYDFARAILTLVMFAVFIAIFAWAWSGKRRGRFEEAARLALEEEPGLAPAAQRRGPRT